MLQTKVPSLKSTQNAELSMGVGLIHKIDFLSANLWREIFA